MERIPHPDNLLALACTYFFRAMRRRRDFPYRGYIEQLLLRYANSTGDRKNKVPVQAKHLYTLLHEAVRLLPEDKA